MAAEAAAIIALIACGFAVAHLSCVACFVCNDGRLSIDGWRLTADAGNAIANKGRIFGILHNFFFLFCFLPFQVKDIVIFIPLL